jgi:hypothetical protein
MHLHDRHDEAGGPTVLALVPLGTHGRDLRVDGHLDHG